VSFGAGEALRARILAESFLPLNCPKSPFDFVTKILYKWIFSKTAPATFGADPAEPVLRGTGAAFACAAA
jgi:hypothetical protein